jgi:hypothetical protein
VTSQFCSEEGNGSTSEVICLEHQKIHEARILLLASATRSLHNTLELTAKLLPSQETATTGKTLTTTHFILHNGALRGWEVSVLSNTSYLSSRIHFLPAAITLGGTWLLKYNTYHAYICIYILLTQQDILSSGDIR